MDLRIDKQDQADARSHVLRYAYSFIVSQLTELEVVCTLYISFRKFMYFKRIFHSIRERRTATTRMLRKKIAIGMLRIKAKIKIDPYNIRCPFFILREA